jgi:hypothetical protein
MTESNDGPANEGPSRAAQSCLSPSDDEGGADATSVEEPLSVFSLRSLAQIKEGEDPRLQDQRKKLGDSFQDLEAQLEKLDPKRRRTAFNNTELQQILDGAAPQKPQESETEGRVWDWMVDKGIPLIRIAKSIGDLALEVRGADKPQLDPIIPNTNVVADIILGCRYGNG